MFNPNTEEMEAEPSLRTGPPAGWTSVGAAARPPYHTGSYMVFDDDDATNFIRAQKTLSSVLSSGVWMLEARVNPMSQATTWNMSMVQDSTAITFTRYVDTPEWSIRASGGSNVKIADFQTGWQILGTLLNIGANQHYGELNRGNRTAATTPFGSITTGIDKIWMNTSGGGKEKLAVDWVIIRKSALNEPTVTVQ